MKKKRELHKIQHKKQERVLLPLIAIEKNILFLRDGGRVQFSCGATGIAHDIEEIHMLAESTDLLVKTLYGNKHNSISFLRNWYDRLGDQLQSLVFIYFRVKIDEE